MRAMILTWLAATSICPAQGDVWRQAEENAQQAQRAIKFCNRYAHGWLSHADSISGLLPRTVKGEQYWNAPDCAADNYPFIVLTAHITDDYYLKQIARTLLDTEQKLTNRLDGLPDDFDFAKQAFRNDQYDIDRLIFGASEYAKDGLMPITEWIGPSPWLDRMEQLIRDIWKHAPHETPAGKIPSRSVEVNGELLQTMSRLYWLTRCENYLTWVFQLSDYYFLYAPLSRSTSLRLRDHGCEIVGGLSEAYVIASRLDPDRYRRYQPEMHAVLDAILKAGINDDGMMVAIINPKEGTRKDDRMSDTWGYVYDAFATVTAIDDVPRYRDAIKHVLENVHKYHGKDHDGLGGADGYADSIEGAINLLNRFPVESAFQWVDEEIKYIYDHQRHDGIIEGWYGDGNSARTVLMVALWKTQGITAAPWREDVLLGATHGTNGTLYVTLKSEWSWTGTLRFDRPRHKDVFHMPIDYPRINQFPEWFTVATDRDYTIAVDSAKPKRISGKDLLRYKLSLKPGESIRLTISDHVSAPAAALRQMRYTSRSSEEAVAWQNELRSELMKLLKLDDLRKAVIPLGTDVKKEEPRDSYMLREMELNSTPTRRFQVTVTVPDPEAAGKGPYPAVICTHGHGGDRHAVHNPESIYKGFARELARRGVVTISTNVGQHKVYEPGRMLMGERLWDLMRCVDYLETLPDVDKARIGCAGLSLGGEMAMWLGAMDTRITATCSSGFLTKMDQMEQNHCMCWKFTGLRELVDFSDIYSLTAPRALQCQNGLKEGPHMFTVPLAREVMEEIAIVYKDFKQPDRVQLAVHDGGHEVDLPSLLTFFEKHLSISPSP